MGNEGQSNADLALGKPGRAYPRCPDASLVSACIPAALERRWICLNGLVPTWNHGAMKR
jgi:hypothetical protein